MTVTPERLREILAWQSDLVKGNPAPAQPSREPLARARRWLATRQPAIQGQQGDTHTFATACALVRGFELSDDEAVELMRPWNETCQPPWSESELAQKVRSARRSGTEPFGYLLRQSGVGSEPGEAPKLSQTKPSSKPKPPAPSTGEDEEPKKTGERLLLSLLDECELFFATNKLSPIAIFSHPETGVRLCSPVEGTEFRSWLVFRYQKQTGLTPQGDYLKRVIELASARARFEAPRGELFSRSAHLEGVTYLATGRASGEVLQMKSEGCEVCTSPAGVYFETSASLAALPLPVAGGDFRAFQRLFGLDEYAFRLLVAVLVHYASGIGPFVVLQLLGPAGSGKTTLARALRWLLDPRHSWESLACTMPSGLENIWMTLLSNGITIFDNISYLGEEISDLLCLGCTGGSWSKRKNYTDDENHVTTVKRPIILTSVAPRGIKPDLKDRSVVVNIPARTQGMDESAFIRQLTNEVPRLLGCICRAVSIGLKMRGKAELPPLGRMADFCRFIVEAEAGGAFPWPVGGFLEAYRENRREQTENTVFESPIGESVFRFLHSRTSLTWEGTASDLAQLLPTPENESPRNWPPPGNLLTRKLRELTPALLTVGIEYSVLQRSSTAKGIRLTRSQGPTSVETLQAPPPPLLTEELF